MLDSGDECYLHAKSCTHESAANRFDRHFPGTRVEVQLRVLRDCGVMYLHANVHFRRSTTFIERFLAFRFRLASKQEVPQVLDLLSVVQW